MTFFLFLEILKGKKKMGNNNDSMKNFLQYLSYMFFWNVLKMSFLKHIWHFWSIIFAILKRFWHRSSNMSPRSRVRDLVISSFLNRPSIRICCFVELSSRAKDRLGFSSNCNRFVCRNIFILNVRPFEYCFVMLFS